MKSQLNIHVLAISDITLNLSFESLSIKGIRYVYRKFWFVIILNGETS